MSLLEQYEEAVENLVTLRSKLYSAKAINYDKPCVKSGNRSDLADKISDLLEAERRVMRLKARVDAMINNIMR